MAKGHRTLLESILDNAQEAILITSVSGEIVRANLMAEQLFGRAVSELVGENVGALMSDTTAAMLDRMMSENPDRLEGVLPIDKFQRGEALTRRDRAVPVRFTLGSAESDDGVWFILCIQDAGEHHEFERARELFETVLDDQADRRAQSLRESRARQVRLEETERTLLDRESTIRDQLGELERLYAVAPEALGHLDVELVFVRVNAKLAQLAGVRQDELIGARADSFDAEPIRRLVPFCRRVLETGESVLAIELAVVLPDAPEEQRYYLVNFVPITGDGGPLRGVHVSWTDITQWKHAEAAYRDSEERFRRLSEATFEGVVIHRAGIVLECNEAFADLLGASSRDALVGANLVDTLPVPEARAAFEAYLQNRSEGRFETIARHNQINVEVRSRAIEFHDAPAHVLGVRDITERVRAEHQTRQVQRLEALATLAGGIAHDFNNVLAAVLGYAELAYQDAAEEGSVQSDLREVIAAAERAKGLVRQILAFSHNARRNATALDLSALVSRRLEAFRAEIPPTVRVVDDTVSVTGPVMADPDQLETVTMNLLRNACQAMERTGGELYVSVREVTISRDARFAAGPIEPGAYVRLRVRDTGLGMTPETMERIYEPFFTTRDTGEGAGIGLSAVYGIARLFGGTTSVESTPGEGTQVDVYFPIVAARTETEHAFETDVRRETSPRVLVVDDEDSLMKMMVRSLESAGYQAEGYTDPRRAIEVFSAAPDRFNLLITDFSMPDMSGLDVIRALQAKRRDLPTMIVTGYRHLLDEDEANRLAVRTIADKPFRVPEFVEIVGGILPLSGADRDSSIDD